jgi:hypothetical protein
MSTAALNPSSCGPSEGDCPHSWSSRPARACRFRHEADRFRANLNLEQAFEVRYWDQRGCGPVDQRDAYGVSLPRQAAVTPVRRLNNSRPQNLPFVSNRRANCASGRYTSDLPDIGDPCPVTRAYPDAG